MNIELTGTFCNERHRWESTREGESDTIVGSIRSSIEGGSLISIRGQSDKLELRQGLSYRFFGHWKDYRNPRSGLTERQFNFNSFVESAPAGREAIAAYISAAGEGLGIGPQRARKLFDLFGEDAVKVLREDPQRAAEALSKARLSVDPAMCVGIAEILRSKQATEAVQIELTSLLAGRGFPRTTTRNAIQRWGAKAARIIRRDPYRLMVFQNCGFKKTDAMYLDLGLKPDRLKRQALCAWYSIASDSDGHTWFPAFRASNYITQNITGAAVNPELAMRLAIRAGVLGQEYSRGVSGPLIQDASGVRWIAEGKNSRHEKQIAELAARAMQDPHRWPDPTKIAGLSEHQKEQLTKALSSPIAILGGSPGTGKTYTAGLVIQELGKTFGLNNIIIAAPTGKAAVRLTENLVKLGIDIRAKTVASWLNWLDRQKETTVFPHQVIVVDEDSMSDTDAKAALMRGAARGTHFLFIGDIYQLPPVGHGAPLRDLIAAGVPYGELREIRRNSGGIVEACAAIRDGASWGEGNNLVITGCSDAEKQIATMLRICREAKTQGLDPVWDVQIIAAVNEKSPLARTKLNDILQAELNLNAGQSGQLFRLNDKVVNLENNKFQLIPGSQEEGTDDDSESEPSKNGTKESFVANGELGRVVEIAEAFFLVELSSPRRIIRVPRGKAKAATAKDKEAEPIDGEKIASGCTFDLGYGLTCHKMQGSSARWVVVMLDEYPGAMRVASREWLYTAISRAEQYCYLVGKKQTADRMTRNISLQKRKTFLRERVAIETSKLLLSGGK